ncbi:hypothetical protein BOX15_Mlig001885g6, partial [Macrostomum lignano]
YYEIRCGIKQNGQSPRLTGPISCRLYQSTPLSNSACSEYGVEAAYVDATACGAAGGASVSASTLSLASTASAAAGNSSTAAAGQSGAAASASSSSSNSSFRCAAVSKLVQVMYKDQLSPLEDAFLFRVDCLVDPECPLDSLSALSVSLLVELWFTDEENSDTIRPALKLVSSRELRVTMDPTRGFHCYVPCIFDYYYLSCVEVMVHACLTGFGTVKLRGSHSGTNLAKQASAENFSSLTSLNVQNPEDSLSALQDILVGKNQSVQQRRKLVLTVHNNVCHLLLSAYESLQASLKQAIDLLPPMQQMQLDKNIRKLVKRENQVDCSSRLASLSEQIHSCQGDEELLRLATGHMTALVTDLQLLWERFISTACLQESVIDQCARQYHAMRVRRFAEGYFRTEKLVGDLFRLQDASPYESLAQLIRTSAYYSQLAQLPLHCPELDGDPATMPLIFEDVYPPHSGQPEPDPLAVPAPQAAETGSPQQPRLETQSATDGSSSSPSQNASAGASSMSTSTPAQQQRQNLPPPPPPPRITCMPAQRALSSNLRSLSGHEAPPEQANSEHAQLIGYRKLVNGDSSTTAANSTGVSVAHDSLTGPGSNNASLLTVSGGAGSGRGLGTLSTACSLPDLHQVASGCGSGELSGTGCLADQDRDGDDDDADVIVSGGRGGAAAPGSTRSSGREESVMEALYGFQRQQQRGLDVPPPPPPPAAAAGSLHSHQQSVHLSHAKSMSDLKLSKLVSAFSETTLANVQRKEAMKREMALTQLDSILHLYSDFRLSALASTDPPFRDLPDLGSGGGSSGRHLVVCAHGLEGNSGDLRLVRVYLTMALPNERFDFLMSDRNQLDTYADIKQMRNNLVEELLAHLSAASRQPTHISFIGHSLGTIIIRAAVSDSRLAHLRSKFHTFLSLSGPHLGALYNTSNLVNAGMWFIQKMKKSGSILQLKLKDNSDQRQTYLYELSSASGLDSFANVLLVSSPQDRYVPYHSSRVELASRALKDTGQMSAVYMEMVSNLLQRLSKVLTVRYDVHHCFPSSTNSLIGRAAHIAVLDSEVFLDKFISVSAAKYFSTVGLDSR